MRTIHEVSSLTRPAFVERFASMRLPVILRGAAADWPAIRNWTPEFLGKTCGDVLVATRRSQRSSSDVAATRKWRLAEYLQYAQAAPTDPNPWYLADWHFDVDAPGLLEDMRPLEVFQVDWLMECAADIFPSYLWMFVGPPDSGTPPHTDIIGTSAWCVQVLGEKHWQFASDDGKAIVEGVARPGDCVFAPSGKVHSARNLSMSISVTRNYVDETNFTTVLASLLSAGHLEAHAALKAASLRCHSPPSSSAAIPAGIK